ncbi:MAG TPA: PQ-loop repeat-containing protein [Patescibacteria group bacterium]|nr:PQ-loop repeat-containing protein [Patescibacteria group bacterium]
MQLLGHITLNISLIVYLIWFIPQIFHNFKRKNTNGLSMLMIGILSIGYLCDLMYGFGREMQWQYRLVTLTGIGCLMIQNYQFGRYGLNHFKEKTVYISLNMIYVCLLIYAILSINLSFSNKNGYDFFGMIAQVCWLSYMVPQIIKNAMNRSTLGLSTSFVGLSILLNLCDFISAWTLNWDYPSKIGPAVTLSGHLVLFFQMHYFARFSREPVVLMAL